MKKKKKEKHDKIVLLAKSKLDSIEVLSSKVLVDSNISHDQFVLIHNLLRKIVIQWKKIENSSDKKSLNFI